MAERQIPKCIPNRAIDKDGANVKNIGKPREKQHLNILNRLNRLIIQTIFMSFGLALLIVPDASGRIFLLALAGLMALAGLYFIIVYFYRERTMAVMRNDFTAGLTLLTGSIVLFSFPEVPCEALPYIWSGSLMIGGFLKLQRSIDMYRLSAVGWHSCLICAAVSIALGTIALCNPFEKEQILLRFLGGGLLIEGVMDSYCLHMVSRLRRAVK